MWQDVQSSWLASRDACAAPQSEDAWQFKHFARKYAAFSAALGSCRAAAASMDNASASSTSAPRGWRSR